MVAADRIIWYVLACHVCWYALQMAEASLMNVDRSQVGFWARIWSVEAWGEFASIFTWRFDGAVLPIRKQFGSALVCEKSRPQSRRAFWNSTVFELSGLHVVAIT